MIDPLNPSSLGAARKAVKLTRAELAKLSGVAETTIMRIEKGEVDPKTDGTWAPIVRAIQKRPESKVATPTEGSRAA